MSKFSKLYIALKFRLHGMGFFKAMEALEFARDIHNGFRKDGITPEFQHQLEIAHYVLSVLMGGDTKKKKSKKFLLMCENTVIAAILHDTDEDNPFDIPSGKLESFGKGAAKSVLLLNKHRSADYPEYFGKLGEDVIGALVKGADRINNFQSMNRGNFSIEKQKKYAEEVMKYFLPMLKRARKKFPELMDVFYNIEFILKSQHELITLFIESKEAK